jgi:hypothetical protein
MMTFEISLVVALPSGDDCRLVRDDHGGGRRRVVSHERLVPGQRPIMTDQAGRADYLAVSAAPGAGMNPNCWSMPS